MFYYHGCKDELALVELPVLFVIHYQYIAYLMTALETIEVLML